MAKDVPSPLDPATLRALADMLEARGGTPQARRGLRGRLRAALSAAGDAGAGAVQAVGQAAAVVRLGAEAAAEEVRDVAIFFRVSRGVRQQVKQLAARDGTTVDALMREAVDDLLRKKGYLLAPPP